MNNLGSLVRRDAKIFYRTKGNIFFSLLSVIILIVLHFIVFREMYADDLMGMVSQFPGVAAERGHILWLVDSLMFSAIIPIAAITLSLTTLGLMVEDKATNALADFLVSPIGRNSLFTSYLASSFAVGFIALFGIVAFFDIFFLIAYGVGFSLAKMGLILLVTAGSLIFANVFMLLLLTFIKTQQSLGAVGTIVGTLMGFITGAYIPISMFGKVVADIFSALPFLQITVLSRQAFLCDIETAAKLPKAMISGEAGRMFGIELWIGNTYIPPWGAALLAAGVTLILLLFVIVRFNRMKRK